MANRVHRIENPLSDALDSAAGQAATAEDRQKPFVMDGMILSTIERATQIDCYVPLGPTEYTAMQVCFTEWAFRSRNTRGVAYHIAERPVSESVEESIEYSNNGRRMVFARNGLATLLMQHTVLAADLSIMCSIERQALGLKPADTQRRPENMTEPLSLSADQHQITQRLGVHTRAEIAQELGIESRTVNARVKQAMLANGYRSNMTGFVTHAFRDGVIPADDLPTNAGATLNEAQRELLSKHALNTQSYAVAAAMGLAGNVVTELWRDIYAQFGLAQPTRGQANQTRTQALLIALRDGLLDESDNA